MARAGNYSVVICFMGALAVNSLYFDGSEVQIWVLAPVFLLLETKHTFLEVSPLALMPMNLFAAVYQNVHRYFVPVLVCSGTMCASVLIKLHFRQCLSSMPRTECWSSFLLRYLHLAVEHYATSSWLMIAKHDVLLALTLPSHYLTLSYLSTQGPHRFIVPTTTFAL